MNISALHPHNRDAYNKVMKHFKAGHQKACVIHATGTGKSYIITAVADQFERVLILTTNMFVIDQVQNTINSESPNRRTPPVYLIYQSLLQQMNVGSDYTDRFDLIVLDEFHHGGAEKWGRAVDWILQQNPSAKVLGTSATSIRYSDGGRDMAFELFDGHIVSTLTIGEAWARKILMAPYYIMAVEDSEEFHKDFIARIDVCHLPEEKKIHYRQMACNVRDNYEMEKNAPDIVRKWLPADSRRVIVFSKDINEADCNTEKVSRWLLKAGISIAGTYRVHSKLSFEEKKRQMKNFQEDGYTGVKLMIAVDMLNEGVHIPRVDAVFFLRKTESPTIFMQQLGRCMGSYKDNGRRPVVFDFRNNVENTRRTESNTRSFFNDVATEYDGWICQGAEKTEVPAKACTGNHCEQSRDNFPDGINYTMDYAVMLDRFGEDIRYQEKWELLEEYAAMAEEYYQKHGKKIPNRAQYKTPYIHLMRFWNSTEKKAERSDITTILKNSGFKEIEKDKLMLYAIQANKYFTQHGEKIPSSGEYQKISNYLSLFMREEKRRAKKPDIVEILQNSGFDCTNVQQCKHVQRCKKEDLLMKYALQNEEYYKIHKKKTPSKVEYKNLHNALNRFWKDEKRRAERPDVVEILQRSGFKDKVQLDIIGMLLKYEVPEKK